MLKGALPTSGLPVYIQVNRIRSAWLPRVGRKVSNTSFGVTLPSLTGQEEEA